MTNQEIDITTVIARDLEFVLRHPGFFRHWVLRHSSISEWDHAQRHDDVRDE